MAEVSSLPELNAVLVGSKGSWKHLVGNIILGGDCEFTTDISAESETRGGTVCGRKVTLVKAPSWWRGYPLCDTPALFKTEMTLCAASLCRPSGAGPHAFLLVINTNLVFKESYRRATVEHLQSLYGGDVWAHTVIVFCSGLARPAVADYIQSEGVPLQSLMRQCGDRYHVLCNEDMNSVVKVKELFDKIDAMVSANGRYQIDGELMQSAEDKRREVEQKAAAMQLTSKTQRLKLRGLITDHTGGWRPELRILILGWVFSGKSKAANTILNAEEFQAGSRTLQSTVRSGEVDGGRRVTVVDTPGWWKFFPAEFTSPAVKAEVTRAVSLCSPSPNVVLLMFPPSTSFTEEQLEITLDNMNKLLGESVWRHVIVVFTFGDCLGGNAVEHHIASEGKPLCALVKLCGNRYHCLRSKNNKDDRTQVTELLEKMEEMVAGNFFYWSAEPEEGGEEEEPPSGTSAEGRGVVGDGRDDEAAKEVNHELDMEWDRQNWEMRHIVKGNGSLELPPLMEEPCKKKAKSSEETWRKSGRHGDAHDAQRTELTAYSTLLEREWNRRETCMELNLGGNIWTIGFQSEPDAKEKQESCVKVRKWLETTPGSSSGRGTTGSSVHEDKREEKTCTHGAATDKLLSIEQIHTGTIPMHGEFTPDIIVVENKESYRFHCTHAGLFRCSATGLGFKMEKDGEVTYGTVPWGRGLLSQLRKKPAGPLFDVKASQGSVCQLHIPHCEILSTGGGGKSLSVVHVVDDDGFELIKPRAITETHVIIDVTGLSFFGIVMEMLFGPRPVQALVPVFYKPPMDDDHPSSTLKVLLLPRNVVLDEVKSKRRELVGEEIYIERPPCKLVPNQEYTLSTSPEDDSIIIEPVRAVFEVDECSYHNYVPTFVIHLERRLSHVRLLLSSSNTSECAWECYVNLQHTTPSHPATDKLLSVRSSFINGISHPILNQILDKLLEKGVIIKEEYDEACAKKVIHEKARLVIDTVRSKGNPASLKLIFILRETDPFLSEGLGLM